jgi:hypothetical protein
MDGRCLYIEAIAELRSHVEMKMSSWCFFCRSKAPAWSLQAQLWAGEAPPPCSPLLRNGARGSPTPSCGSGTGLPPVTQNKHQEGHRGRL